MKRLLWSIGITLWGGLSGIAGASDMPLTKDAVVVNRRWEIHSAHVRGGDFWTGYSRKTADFRKSMLDGSWDRKTPLRGIVTVRKSRALSAVEQQNILNHLRRLEPSRLPQSPCGIIADGPEEFLVLNFRNENGAEKKLNIVSEDKRRFVCGDRYVTPASYAKLVAYVERLLPEPPAKP